jgi:hypothetical protein
MLAMDRAACWAVLAAGALGCLPPSLHAAGDGGSDRGAEGGSAGLGGGAGGQGGGGGGAAGGGAGGGGGAATGGAGGADAGIDQGRSDGSPATGLNAGLVGYWPFDSAGTVYPDRSGNHNDATTDTMFAIAPTWTAAGKIGGAVQFDQGQMFAQSWLQVASSQSLDSISSAFTMAAWIKLSGANVVGAIAARQYADNDSWGLEVDGSEQLGILISTLTTAVGKLPTQQWVHVAGTRDATSLTIYVGGQVKAAYGGSGPNLTPLTAYPLVIGAQDVFVVGFTDGFNGAIDELVVYNRALSATEIASLAGGATPTPQ